MNRLIATAVAGIALSACATAQEAPEPAAADSAGIAPLLGHFSFKTLNPGGVVGALDVMMETCGDQIPAAVTLLAETFNGDDPTTHTAIFSYPDGASAQQTAAAFQSCEGAEAFYETVNEISKPTAQYLGQALAGGGDPSLDQVFMAFRMNVSDEAAYGAAFQTYMDASSDILPGSYGLVRVTGGGGGDQGTHYAFVGGPDLDSVLAASNAIQSPDHAPRQAFSDAVDEIRQVIDARISFRVKDYNQAES